MDGMNRVTTILFDLSEVFIAGLVGIEYVLARMLGETPESVRPRFGCESLYRLCRGEISEDHYLLEVIRTAGWHLSVVKLKRVIRDNFRNEVEGTIGLLPRLSATYDLVLVSDHAREWIAHIEQIHPFLDAFSKRVYSFETHMIKSDPTCFPAILDLVGKSASECVFVDDQSRNCEQARRAGIRAIPFLDCERLKADFAHVGVSAGES